MRYDDLDRTSVLVRKEKNTSDGRTLDDTQEPSCLVLKMLLLFFRGRDGAELPPLTSKMEHQRVDAAESGNSGKADSGKGADFCRLFCGGSFCGFLLSDMFLQS